MLKKLLMPGAQLAGIYRGLREAATTAQGVPQLQTALAGRQAINTAAKAALSAVATTVGLIDQGVQQMKEAEKKASAGVGSVGSDNHFD